MCGIAGVLNDNLIHDKVSNKFIEALTHRGPDSNGSWISQEDRVLLAHTRLSIQDLSENGNQPMASSTGKLLMFLK
jgi:asparagine synthase (glutamine-hydrolysing)